MNSFFDIVKYDYLQRTRSYTFLVTLCFSLALAYTFVPEPNANYSTIRIADYLGNYNSAWFGYVTAMMTSVFLSLIGFYLVNSGIRKDRITKVGQIVAATAIKNFKYLLAKAISNFVILFTIVVLVFLMSLVLFFLYNDGSPFEIGQFVTPYLLITVPAIFVVSVMAVVFEVILGKYSVVQNIAFFFAFAGIAVNTPESDTYFTLDILGSKMVTQHMEKTVRTLSNVDEKVALSIGYVIGNVDKSKKFEFNGITFPYQFTLSRLAWIISGVLLLALISPFFHRFALRKQRAVGKLKLNVRPVQTEKEILLSSLPTPQTDYGILAFVKTEIRLLIYQGKKWLWFINLLGMLLLLFLPLEIAHHFVLSILWFLQVGRLSELTTKEMTYGVHYFAFTSYKPLSRLLLSQMIAGMVLMLFLAIPILVRYGLQLNYNAMASIGLGGLFIVLFASLLGILTKGKKLFEVLFFMITYAAINGVVFFDYLGAVPHDHLYLLRLALVTGILGVSSFFLRYNDLRR